MKKQKPKKSSAAQSMVRRWWFWLIVGLLVLSALLLVFTPFGIDYGIERWLRSQGVDQAQVSDVDFNPFTRQLRLYGLNVAVGDARVLKIEKASLLFSWSPFFKKRLQFKEVKIDGLDLTIEQLTDDRIRIGGIAAPLLSNQKPENFPWEYGLSQLQINNGRIQLLAPKANISLTINNSRLSRVISWQPEQLARFDLSGRINGSELRVEADINAFAVKPKFKGKLKLIAMDLAPLSGLVTPHLDMLAGRLNLDMVLEGLQTSENDFRLTQQGRISLEQVHLKRENVEISENQLTWNGTLRFTIPQKAEPLHIYSEGQLNGGPFRMNMPSQKMILNHSSFVWDGKLGYGGESPDTVTADGKFRMNGMQINHVKKNLNLLELKQLTLDGIKMEKLQRLNVSKAQINELNLLKSSESKKTPDEGTALVSLTRADFENIVFSPGSDFGMDSAVLKNAVLYLHHTKAGQWANISDLGIILAADGRSVSKPQAQSKFPAKPSAGNKAETEKFGFRIDKLQFVGDSAVRFVDETVDPPYYTKLNFTQAVVSDLDNHRPEQLSPLELKASVGKYSRVNLQGNFQPFRERFSMDVTGNIEALDLPPISPYTVKSLGYNFVSGQMDTDVNLKIVLGKLQGESNFRLNNLIVKAADNKMEAGQDTGLKIPLESTLKLLRDKKNNIQLKVSIFGDITDPQFSFSDAINQAVVKALTMASFSYLKYMLGPYGTAIGIAELAIKAVPGIRLQPVVFEPGSSDLNQDAVAYLNKVATILRDRLDLQVSVCGLSTEADRSLLNEHSLKQNTASSTIDGQLLKLAQKRAESIKDHLIALYEIENKRIFICKPELDKNAEAPPRAELLV